MNFSMGSYEVIFYQNKITMAKVYEFMESLRNQVIDSIGSVPALVYRSNTSLSDKFLNEKYLEIESFILKMNLDSLSRMDRILDLLKDQWQLIYPYKNSNDISTLENILDWFEELPFRVSRATESLVETQYEDLGYVLGYLNFLPKSNQRLTQERVQPFII